MEYIYTDVKLLLWLGDFVTYSSILSISEYAHI